MSIELQFVMHQLQKMRESSEQEKYKRKGNERDNKQWVMGEKEKEMM